MQTDNTNKLDLEQQIRKIRNFEILEEFRNLKNNWDGEGAKAFKLELIEKVKEIIARSDLNNQPDIFPTFRESIQLEYEKADGDYLEIEISLDEIRMLLQKTDSEKEEILTDTDSVISAIKRFYAQS